jgi:hypothetical protein
MTYWLPLPVMTHRDAVGGPVLATYLVHADFVCKHQQNGELCGAIHNPLRVNRHMT